MKEAKWQGRIAHHHADATVPHIVALLGLSFYVCKDKDYISKMQVFAYYYLHFS